MTLLASSCIVADPPEYREAVRTRPVLDVYQAIPTTTQVQVLNTNDVLKISVPVRSEDAGEVLRGAFFVDYGVGSPGQIQNVQEVPASTYADDGRAFTLDWTVPKLANSGCHLLSLIVAHVSSFRSNPSYVLNNNANNDAAIISWWLNVDAPAQSASTLSNCPTAGIAMP